VYQDEDGMVVIRGRLTPEQGAVLMQALEAARETLYQKADVSEEMPSMEQQRPTRPTRSPCLPRAAFTVISITEPEASATRLSSMLTQRSSRMRMRPVNRSSRAVRAFPTSRRLACDATRVIMRHDGDGRTMEVGARTRTIPPALRRALHYRDRGCRFPGCAVRSGQGHHIRHWATGGPTTLSNLAMLCRWHHRAVHEGGYQVERLPEGMLEFRAPSGRVLPNVPSLVSIPDDPVESLRAGNQAARLDLDGWALCSTALWEPLDVGWAIDVLHPRALQPATIRDQ
jgi:Domain of unknown function (DUF222)/HNH endonuclease